MWWHFCISLPPKAFPRGESENSRLFVPVNVCVCPVTSLVSEVLNHDGNSRYAVMPAAPITRRGEHNGFHGNNNFSPSSIHLGAKPFIHRLEWRSLCFVRWLIILWLCSRCLTEHRLIYINHCCWSNVPFIKTVISDLTSKGRSHI